MKIVEAYQCEFCGYVHGNKDNVVNCNICGKEMCFKCSYASHKGIKFCSMSCMSTFIKMPEEEKEKYFIKKGDLT